MHTLPYACTHFFPYIRMHILHYVRTYFYLYVCTHAQTQFLMQTCTSFLPSFHAYVVLPFLCMNIHNRASRLIKCDCHVHPVSKAGSVISSKSPSRAFRWSSIYYTELQFTDKLCEKSKIKKFSDDIIARLWNRRNCLHSFPVNYGSVL